MKTSSNLSQSQDANIEYSMIRTAPRSGVARSVRLRSARFRGARSRGFTLIELLVVIAIVAILSALLIGGFFQISASNRRSGCQVNMSQIYNALRLYSQDYDGQYPYYNNSTNGANNLTDYRGVPVIPAVTGPPAVPERRSVDTMGLWRLFTTEVPDDDVNVNSRDLGFRLYKNTANGGTTPKIVGTYLRSLTNLHCPSDDVSQDADDDGNNGTPAVKIADDQPYLENGRRFNPNYLSYQTLDDGKELSQFSGSTVIDSTYQTQRTADYADPNWKRQLSFWDGTAKVLEQQPASNTVILWCKWHRTGLGGRNMDNVLFADGSVRTRPLSANPLAAGQPEKGWLRSPETN